MESGNDELEEELEEMADESAFRMGASLELTSRHPVPTERHRGSITPLR